MNSVKGLVSVVINCHNCSKFLSEAIESVLNQTYQNWEIVFWDNASTENVKNIVLKYDDQRIRYFFDRNFSTLGMARNKALKEARGDYIAFLDADDYWAPEKLTMQMQLFKDPKVGLVYCDANIVYDGVVLKRFFGSIEPPEGKIFNQVLGSYFLVMSATVIRKTALESLNRWFDPRYEIIEEYDLFLRISVNWEFRCARDVLASWRWHKTSTTMQNRRLISREKRMLLKSLKKEFPEEMHENHEVEKKVKGKILVSLAIALFFEKNSRGARRVLRKSKTYSAKGVFVYFASYFPVEIVDFLYRKLKGNPLV